MTTTGLTMNIHGVIGLALSDVHAGTEDASWRILKIFTASRQTVEITLFAAPEVIEQISLKIESAETHDGMGHRLDGTHDD